MTNIARALAFSGSMLLAIGSAQAGELFELSEAHLDAVTAAGTVNFLTEVVKTVDIDKTVDLVVNKTVFSEVDVDGYLATAEASADAIEFSNVLAETDTFAQVSSSGAFSFSESLAAGDNNPGGGGGGGGGG